MIIRHHFFSARPTCKPRANSETDRRIEKRWLLLLTRRAARYMFRAVEKNPHTKREDEMKITKDSLSEARLSAECAIMNIDTASRLLDNGDDDDTEYALEMATGSIKNMAWAIHVLTETC